MVCVKSLISRSHLFELLGFCVQDFQRIPGIFRCVFLIF